jgi:hypothetical protein
MAQSYLNKKQEVFAMFLSQGATQLEAYTNAGYEPSSSNANTLANKPLVKARVEELRKAHEEREMEFKLLAQQASQGPEVEVEVRRGAEWTFQRIMDMMGENVRLAQIAGEYKAANECLKMMGESMKMFEKATQDNGNKTPTQGPLALIGQVTQFLGDASQHGNSPGDNALRPGLGRAREAESVGNA